MHQNITNEAEHSPKKSGTITRSERSTSNQLVESMLTEHKSKIGDVIHVVINERTTIELPASLSKDEIDARVENYKKLHKSKG